MRGICSAGGLTAVGAAERHDFSYACSNYEDLLADDAIDAVVIATRHDTHARFAMDALKAGKHVFVEKPLALDYDELSALVATAETSGLILLPGFNRRFSPLAIACRDHFSEAGGALEAVCRVNAGHIDAESWYQDSEEGGWRIVSEGCHWIDLLSFLLRSNPKAVSARSVAGAQAGAQNDSCSALIAFENGAIATLSYLSNGDATFPKESIEVFGQGKTAAINNWRNATLYADGKSTKIAAQGSGKGHKAELAAFVDAVSKAGSSPISLSSGIATTRCAIAIQQSILSDGQMKRV